MTLRQFARRTSWPIEELEAMPFTDCLRLLGIYDMGIDIRDKRTKKVIAFFSDYSWRDA